MWTENSHSRDLLAAMTGELNLLSPLRLATVLSLYAAYTEIWNLHSVDSSTTHVCEHEPGLSRQHSPKSQSILPASSPSFMMLENFHYFLKRDFYLIFYKQQHVLVARM